jgi:hypothetical protein
MAFKRKIVADDEESSSDSDYDSGDEEPPKIAPRRKKVQATRTTRIDASSSAGEARTEILELQ